MPGDLDRARIGTRVVDEFGAARREQAADDADARLDLGRLDRLRDATERDDRAVSAAARVGQKDRAVVGVEQVLRVTRDPIHHHAEIECCRNVAADLGQRGRLAAAALRLVKQPRVLERDAHAVGKHLQQPHVRLVECVLVLPVSPDHAERLVTLEYRHAQIASGQVIAVRIADLLRAELRRARLEILVDEERRARANDFPGQPDPERERLDRKALAVLEVIRHGDQVGHLVVERHAHVARVEDLGDLVPDQVDDCLEVELGREPLLHAVDDGELGGALALRREALRVLQRHAEAGRDGGNEIDVGLGKRIRRPLPQRDHAGGFAAADHRRVNARHLVGNRRRD